MFHQQFSDWSFPRFLQGPYLKTALTLLPQSATNRVWIMVPYIVQSEILHSILQIPEKIRVLILTRDYSGYLPNIKSGARPALRKLEEKSNIEVMINNDIHAKILLVDDRFVVVHSMNATPRSETVNHEAGIVSIDSDTIRETEEYFDFVRSLSKPQTP